ncbi:MAG TPA: hypothetical protein P5081_23525 [Phycisphaerae bacterium]|nr:hypothetical protein [Phycisphaerae bacterium]HRW55854.1 hypothetical protein [Phycisphaerae bacterium]
MNETMNDRWLDMLKQADDSVAEEATRDDSLFDAAMALAGRRMRRRRILVRSGAAVVILVAVVGAQTLMRWPTHRNEPVAHRPGGSMEDNAAPQSVDAVRREIDLLSREAAMTMAVIDGIERGDRSRVGRQRIRRDRAVRVDVDAAIAAETAAQTILLQADRFAANELTRRLAPDTYRRILELFPDSAAARDAKQRLVEARKGDNA